MSAVVVALAEPLNAIVAAAVPAIPEMVEADWTAVAAEVIPDTLAPLTVTLILAGLKV
jgi:hypothetical protein